MEIAHHAEARKALLGYRKGVEKCLLNQQKVTEHHCLAFWFAEPAQGRNGSKTDRRGFNPLQTWGAEPRDAQCCLVGSPAVGTAVQGGAGGWDMARDALGQGMKPPLCFYIGFCGSPWL